MHNYFTVLQENFVVAYDWFASIYAGINIDQQPESQTKMFGETVEFSFSATASDGGDQRYLKYQWYFKQKNGNEEATPYEIIDNNNSSYSGQDKPILRLKRFSFDHKGWYQCVISVKSGEHTGEHDKSVHLIQIKLN